MTEEKRLEWLAEVKQAAIDDRAPNPVPGIHPLAEGPKRPAVAQPQAAGDSDIFTANDLTRDALPPGREYRVPGRGKRLWIFGATFEDTAEMLKWSLQAEALEADPSDTSKVLAQFAQAKYVQDYKLALVALCCRQGPTRDAPRCFQRQDISGLRAYLGSSVIEEIVRIAGELSGDDEALGGATRRFFGLIRAFLLTLPSASNTSTSSLPGYADIHTRLLSLVTRAASRGRLDAGMLSELDSVEGLL